MSTSAWLLIDEESFVPLTEQIRRQICDQVDRGALGVGERLPTVRQLARDLALAPGTVAKAFQLLEAEGVIETKGRRGTFVARRSVPREPQADPIREAARRYLAEAARLGVGPVAAAAVVAQLAGEASPGLWLTQR